MAAICLFTTKDRDASHRELERVLAEGTHPKAECREMDASGDYTVWSGPAREDEPAEPTPEAMLASLDDRALNRLAELLAARMKGG